MVENRTDALSFGAAAGEYERGRPSYPDEVVDWLLPARARRVLDLGAGTGKLTSSLVARGLEVVAVEPISEMREQLHRTVPDAAVLEGTAESIPLEDASVDAVLVAQAWHWVDVPRASKEVTRVLRPGGTFGLVWNLRDESIHWVAELWRIVMADAPRDFPHRNPPISDLFTAVEHFETTWTQPLTLDDTIALLASRSYVITLPVLERTARLARARTFLESLPDLRADGTLPFPYVTVATRSQKPRER